MSGADELLLARLIRALIDERTAIRALDPVAIRAAAEIKNGLAEELGAVDLASGGRVTRVLAARAHALAHANLLLLDEACRAVGRRLGVPPPGLYDARARRVSHPGIARRAI